MNDNQSSAQHINEITIQKRDMLSFPANIWSNLTFKCAEKNAISYRYFFVKVEFFRSNPC